MGGKYCDFLACSCVIMDNWGRSDTTHTSQFAPTYQDTTLSIRLREPILSMDTKLEPEIKGTFQTSSRCTLWGSSYHKLGECMNEEKSSVFRAESTFRI